MLTAPFAAERNVGDLDTDPDALPSDFFGVHEMLNPSDPAYDMLLSRIRELNLGVVRYSIGWDQIMDQTTEETSNCRNNLLDPNAVRHAEQVLDDLPARVEPHIMLTQVPTACRTLYMNDRAAFRRMWRDYVHQTVSTFEDRVHVWEIWNEPNGNGFALTTPSGHMWSPAQFLNDIVLPAAQEYPRARLVGHHRAHQHGVEWRRGRRLRRGRRRR